MTEQQPSPDQNELPYSVGVSRRRFLGFMGAVAATVAGASMEAGLIDVAQQLVKKYTNPLEKKAEDITEPELVKIVFHEQLQEQVEACVAAEAPTDEFLRENAELLSGITIGCSFSPERMFEVDGSDKQGLDINRLISEQAFYPGDSGPEHQKVQKALRFQKFLTKGMGIVDFRFPTRQNNIITDRGKQDLSLYRPSLDYMRDYKDPKTVEGINAALGIGPLKTDGGDETNLALYAIDGSAGQKSEATSGQPERGSLDTSLLITGKLPPKGSTISLNMKGSDMPQKLLSSEDAELAELSVDYPNLSMIQTDNEPLNYAGTDKYVPSKQFEREAVRIARHWFPDKSNLLNAIGTLGPWDFKNSQLSWAALQEFKEEALDKPIFGELEVLEEFVSHDSPGKGKFVLGFDAYDYTPDSLPAVEVTGSNGKIYKQSPDSLSVMQRSAQVVHVEDIATHLQNMGLGMEVTELQDERWGNLSIPGERPKNLKKMLHRAATFLRPKQTSGQLTAPKNNAPKKVVRIWGVEEMGVYMTTYPYYVSPEHAEGMRIIARINGKTDAEFAAAWQEFIEEERAADYAARQKSIGF